jgi:hypothetical protein
MTHFERQYDYTSALAEFERISARGEMFFAGLVVAGGVAFCATLAFMPNIMLYVMTGTFDLCTLPFRSC